jgi:hypothetical protein
MRMRTVAYNDEGRRIGEGHPRATILDCVVNRIRELHDEGVTYKELSIRFEISIYTVGKICRYERRDQAPHRYAKIPAKEQDGHERSAP